ncbi:unnamed protein product [Caenorhabditis brenneri]
MALILIMGIPASGKSTLRRRLQTAHPDLIESTSFDEFRVSNSTKTTDTARNLRKFFESHVEQKISKIQNSQKIFLIEDIFHLKSMRRPFQKSARKNNLEFGVIHLDVEISEAIRRNSLRRGEEKQKEETILKIFENLEMSEEENLVVLGQEEGKDIGLEEVLKKLGIELTGRRKCDEETEIRRTELKRKNPSPPEIASLPLQDFDVQTRRLVSELIQNDRSLDGRKMSIARTKLISVESNVTLNYTELKLKLLDIYDKL